MIAAKQLALFDVDVLQPFNVASHNMVLIKYLA
jgi:hypothetical protein